MARLAAYYQEDFHYPTIGYGSKRKKSYFVYEEPKNNLFRNYLFNGDRIRNLAISEPALAPDIAYAPKTGTMTLKQRPLVFDNQLTERPQSAMQRCDNMFNAPNIHNRYPLYEQDPLDNESIYSFCEVPELDERYKKRYKASKDRTRKRFSYVEPNYASLHSPDMFLARNVDRFQPQGHPQESHLRNYNNSGLLRSDNCYFNSPDHNQSPAAFYRNDLNYSNWQQLHWASPNSFRNRTLLSPPSPLDSGLSSQSITSSPSLEVEPVPFHADSFSVTGFDQQPGCSCPAAMGYNDHRSHLPNLRRHDSGRSSPGAYSVIHHSEPFPRVKHKTSNGKTSAYVSNDFDYCDQLPNQVRYGKLGIIGEPTSYGHAVVNNTPPDSCARDDVSSKRQTTGVYYLLSDENGVPLRKPVPPKRRSRTTSKYTKPCVILIESPEKYADAGGTASPDQENSNLSQGPESPMSGTLSNTTSGSPSATSSNNDLEVDERHKSSKATEMEIRELEDMYAKCNLGDRDLLDRAERRDLPTVHQAKTCRGNSRLRRSNSDTLYEIMSPVFQNPYETPQRAPPSRRAGLPDKIADDMAMRKLYKSTTKSCCNSTENPITYMLCSSHFTPTVPVQKDILLWDNPDIELDDLSYRKHYFGKKGNIIDPQPPFGIPLRPPPLQRINSDYLHVAPSKIPQPLCHPRGNPDVVRDDMAFRTLRKDESERMYYDIAQVYKKKKG